MAFHIFVQNGVVQAQDPGPAAVFLRSQPSGAYTTTKTVAGASRLILWDRHLQRLSQSVQLLTRNAALDSSKMRGLVKPSLYAGLERALSLRNEEEELVVTVLACITQECVDFSGIFVHVAVVVPSHLKPAEVAVMGPGRLNPLVKSSQWASARQVLEQSKPDGASEVVLSQDGYNLLEGLVSNFFVVAISDEAPGYYVQTAGLEAGVLPGIIRQLVIEICTEKSIPVCQAPPSWEERGKWTEAFITSSVRLLQPVKALQMPVPWNAAFDSKQWSRSCWNPFPLQHSAGPVTLMLQKEVTDRVTYGEFGLDIKNEFN